MARSDLLVSLVRSGTTGDQIGFRRAVEAIIAEENSKQHGILASKLSDALQAEGPKRLAASLSTGDSASLVFEVNPERRIQDLILTPRLRLLLGEVVEEHHRHDLLRSHGLEPRHRLLFEGPPGSGKTSLAEAIATEIMAPLLIVRYEALITSYLGETASKLDSLFESVRSRPCVLFFDEFDTIAKERSDIHETGEIKRVVSSLLLQIDRLPSYVVVVVATNHPELLDKAVWRRFQTRVSLPAATREGIERFLDQWVERTQIPLVYAHSTLAKNLLGHSYAEIEEFVTTVQRRLVLSGGGNPKPLVKSVLDQWREQANQPENGG